MIETIAAAGFGFILGSGVMAVWVGRDTAPGKCDEQDCDDCVKCEWLIDELDDALSRSKWAYQEIDTVSAARDRASNAVGVLQSKLDAIADATRDGKSGTARMIYRMTGR